MDKIVFYRGKLEWWSKIARWVRCRKHGARIGIDDGRVVCLVCGNAFCLEERQPSQYAEAEV